MRRQQRTPHDGTAHVHTHVYTRSNTPCHARTHAHNTGRMHCKQACTEPRHHKQTYQKNRRMHACQHMHKHTHSKKNKQQLDNNSNNDCFSIPRVLASAIQAHPAMRTRMAEASIDAGQRQRRPPQLEVHPTPQDARSCRRYLHTQVPFASATDSSPSHAVTCAGLTVEPRAAVSSAPEDSGSTVVVHVEPVGYCRNCVSGDHLPRSRALYMALA